MILTIATIGRSGRVAGGARAGRAAFLRRPRRRAGLAVGALAVALTAACSPSPSPPSTTPDASPEGPPTTSSGPTAPRAEAIAIEPRLDHVHGLLVDSQGTLLAGTHSGVAAITPDGRTRRVGDRQDDLMGMTGVPGTDLLASSGHPGPGTDLPNPVGLITSDDGGITWTPAALTGEVDFHVLATDGTRVIGYDARAGLLVSADGGATFSPGAAIAPAALAITPAGVWATTADGVQRSTDGALTFETVAGAPLLVLIAAGSDGSLWGVAVDGVAWRSAEGLAWERRGEVGAVEAIAVDDHARGYAATADTLFVLS